MIQNHHIEKDWPSPIRAWYAIIVLVIAALLSYIDRFSLSVLMEPIRKDLNISDVQVSLVAGTAFAIFFAIFALPLGRMVDSYNRTRIIAIGVIVWSSMTVLSGLSQTFWQLFSARMGVAVGEAALASASYSLISDYFPPAKLPVAMSVYVSAVMIGAGFGMVAGGGAYEMAMGMGSYDLAGWIVLRPWQVSMVLIGSPGLLVAMLVVSVKEPVRKNRLRGLVGNVTVALPISSVLKYMKSRAKFLLLHHLGFSALVIYVNGLFIWGPAMFNRTFGWSVASAGAAFGVMILLCGVSGTWCGGFVAQIIDRKDDSYGGILKVALFALMPLILLAPMAPMMPTGETSLALFGVTVFLFSSAMAVAPVTLQLVTPNELRGQIMAVFSVVSVLLGLGIGPTLIALITEYGFGTETGLNYSLAIAGGVMIALAVLLLWLCVRPYAQARKLAEESFEG